jgi:Domain of unknown function (DUF4337)
MDVTEVAEIKPAENRQSKMIGVYIGVLAAILAVCSLGGDNASKDAMRANIDATNVWAFFQAKNVRRTVYTTAADDLELVALANPGLTPEAQTAIKTKVKEYRDRVTLFTSDKKTNEGLDELFIKGKDIEKERDVALRKDPYFDAAQAILQIAIVLASVALIAEVGLLVVFSLVLAALGTGLMINGFLLLVDLPFFG